MPDLLAAARTISPATTSGLDGPVLAGAQDTLDSSQEFHDPDDLFLTSIWIMTADYQLSGAVTLQKIKTIENLFLAMQKALTASNSATALRARGVMNEVTITFPMNLGHRLKDPRILTRQGGTQCLRELRRDLKNAFKKHREDCDGEEIICFSKVFFTANDHVTNETQ